MKSLSNRKDPNENPDVMFKTQVLKLEGEMVEFGLDVGAFHFRLAARAEASFVSRLAEEVLRGPSQSDQFAWKLRKTETLTWCWSGGGRVKRPHVFHGDGVFRAWSSLTSLVTLKMPIMRAKIDSLRHGRGGAESLMIGLGKRVWNSGI